MALYISIMSSNFGFQPTLSGLNTIDSDSTTSSNIVCDTIQINSSGTAPTMSPVDNSTHIATTAFVANAISGAGSNYVTLGTTQTITGQKTFGNSNTFVTGNLITNNIQGNTTTANINIGSLQTSGVLNIGTSSSRTGAINIGTTQTSGIVNIGTSAIYNGTVNIASQTNSYAGVNIGSYNSTTNSVNFNSGYLSFNRGFTFSGLHNDIEFGSGNTFFNVFADTSFNGNITSLGKAEFIVACPETSIAPTTGNMLCNKTYVDTAVSGGLTGYVSIAGTQTITGAKTFNAFAVNQTTGNVDLTLNSNTQRHKLIRGTNSFDTYFVGGTNYSVVMSSTSATANLQLLAGANTMGITMSPAGGLGEGPEIDIQGIAFFPGNVWIDGTNAGMKSFGATNIRYYNPIAPLYLPSSLTSTSLGYQYQLTSTTTPTLGANINVTFTSTGLTYFTLTAGVWLCEAYSGWTQASNNRALSISATSATPDTQRACYSTQQNASFQELTFTTAISVSSTTNYYFVVTSGSNAGSFTNVTHTLRVTRIA